MCYNFSMNLAILLLAAAVSATTPTTKNHTAKPMLPEREWRMIRQIAVNYDLTEDQTWLLAAIRRHENGRPGLEFGIGGPMNSGHPSHRYQDGFKSFYVQGAWAAGTIRKHGGESIEQFGRRYCPPSPEKWSRSIESIIRRLKIEHGGKLPGPKPAKRKIEFP